MNVRSNKLSDIYTYYSSKLQSLFSADESRNLLLTLFEHFFNIDKITYNKNPDYCLSESEMLKIHFGVKELMQHKPIQYVTGIVEFAGLNLVVNDKTLIPRPETEQLVEIIGRDIKLSFPEKLSVLDVGTGSGCIALALKRQNPSAKVYAAEISAEALEVAIENADKNDLDIHFLHADVFDDNKWDLFKNLDIVISNPPYVLEREKEKMNQNVLNFEPGSALFVSDEFPLIYYDAISKIAFRTLKHMGTLYFEINELFGAQTCRLIEGNGFIQTEILKDYFGKDRFIRALKK